MKIGSRWLMVVVVIALAIAMGLAGVALAIQQSHSLSVRLKAHAQLRARQIASVTRRQFDESNERLQNILHAEYCLKEKLDHATSPTLPTWIDGVYEIDQHGYRKLEAAMESPTDHNEAVSATTLTAVQDELFPGNSGSSRDSSGSGVVNVVPERLLTVPTSPTMSPTNSAGRSHEYFSRKWCDESRSRAILAWLHEDRLREAFLSPLMTQDDSLRLVETDRAGDSWSQPLTGPFRHFVIQPSDAFISEQQWLLLGQTLVYVSLTTLALGTLLGGMWLVFKVTRREVELAEMKSNFVADVSHELKTPLAMIHLYAETLQTGRISSDDKRQEYYNVILRESARLTHLIENILNFARIEAGEDEYQKAVVDPMSVIRETYETFKPELDRLGFEHHLTVHGAIPRVLADHDAIAQVLINLISNAIKYSADERCIGIEVQADTRRGKHGVLISIHDRGIGMKPEVRSRVFEGFFRASDDHVRRERGTGLGLALVQRIVHAHGGLLDVESRLVKGSTFRVFLPAVEASPASDAGSPTPNTGSSTPPDVMHPKETFALGRKSNG